LPFGRKGLVLSALVVGSMAPDFEYFLPVSTHGFTHTLEGAFLVALPAGLAALWLFHAVLARPLAALLPRRLHQRLAPLAGGFAWRPWRRFALIVASVLVGALTHVVWDSFTHEQGWAVSRLAFLTATVSETRFGPLKVYKALQHASTLGGLAIVCLACGVWLLRASRRPAAAPPGLSAGRKTAIVAALAAGAAAPVVIYGLAGLSAGIDLASLAHAFARGVVTGMSTGLAGIVVYGVVWHALARPRAGTD
jgi:hypothetical protein